MTIEEIKAMLHTPEYEFLHTDPRLGENIILLGLGGSHAYGTSVPTSDLDIRGIALNSRSDILLGKDFDKAEYKHVDTVIYSATKMIFLLSTCNPNALDLLGLKPEHYLYIHPIGQEILDNKKIFLSQLAIQAFDGYNYQQLKLVRNKSARKVDQALREKYILESIKSASRVFPERYFTCPTDAINLYIDDAVNEKLDKEIFMDVHLTHYPLRDYTCMWNDMRSIIHTYNKNCSKEQLEVPPEKQAKTMMHAIRAYDMAIDILAKGEIITFREKEHDLYMDIRAGKFSNNNLPTDSYWDLLNEREKAFTYAKEHTILPETPNLKEIENLLISINEKAILR